MKRPFLPTILLASALITSFTIGYVLRDAQEPESSRREHSDLGRMTLASAPRRVEIVRPVTPGEDEAGVGRVREGTAVRMPASSWSSPTSRRPSQDDESGFGAATAQPLFTMPQMQPVAFSTFYVPVRAGRPPLSNSEKDKGEKNEDQVPTERAASYAVLGAAGEDEDFPAVKKWLIGEEKDVTVEQVDTLSEGIASKAEVLILLRGRRTVPRITRELIEPFRKRKVLGIGFAAARVFDAAGLKIGESNVTFGPGEARLIPAQENSLVELNETPIAVFDPPLRRDHPFFNETLFAYYVGPLKPGNRDGVEAIAHWQGNETYAPIVRQGNTVLIGVNGRMAKWSSEFRELVRLVASGLATR